MAKMVLTAQFITINANNLAAFCSQAEVEAEVDDVDVTVFTSLGWRERIGGLREAELSLEFFNDFDAGALDSIMWPLLGTVVPFEARATQAARGASNPGYTGSVLVRTWTPLQGSVGDAATASVAFPTSGQVQRLVA